MEVIDVRSDTVTKPTPEMLAAMCAAPVGDDVFDDDPTVHQLQDKLAKMFGKEAGLFCCTGVMANQIGIRAALVTKYSDIIAPEIFCDVNAHTYCDESGGLAYHSRAMVFPLQPDPNTGHLSAAIIKANLHQDRDVHHNHTSLITLEVPRKGRIMPFQTIKEISTLAKQNSVHMHLDGARIFNASVATGVSVKDYGALFDTVSVCLSKGLGAPIGSVILGPKKIIDLARHMRKQLGGGWRQAGLLAAAGIYALDNHVEKMKEDHANAKFAAEQLRKLGFSVPETETNMVWLDSTKLNVNFDDIKKKLREKNILILGSGFSSRIVTHHQLPRHLLVRFLNELRQILVTLVGNVPELDLASNHSASSSHSAAGTSPSSSAAPAALAWSSASSSATPATPPSSTAPAASSAASAASSGASAASASAPSSSKSVPATTAPESKSPGGTTSGNGAVTSATPSGKKSQIGEVLFNDALGIRNAISDTFALSPFKGWILVGYQDNMVTLTHTGQGNIEDLVSYLKDDEVQYAIVRIQLEEGVKDIFLQWIGSKVKPLEKAKKKTATGDVQKILQPTQFTITAMGRSQLTTPDMKQFAKEARPRTLEE